MDWLHGGLTASSARAARPLWAAIIAAAALAAPSIAAAHEAPLCPESWNPHGETIPPAGWSTPPGTTDEGTPVNPDGFFELLTTDGHDLTLTDGCPGVGSEEDGGTGLPFGTFPSGTNIKYTEANGTDEPRVEPMAGNRGGGGGEATAVDYHLWGSGDLWICDALDSDACVCCRVPPPPFSR